MRTVVQEWIDIQNQPITTESDIWLYFYEQGTDTVSKILTKQNIRNFTFKQNGSVINKRYPIQEINFNMFTYCGNAPVFELNTLCCVVFKYRKQDNSDWLSCIIGTFRIVDRVIKANGLTANYTMNNLFFVSYSSYFHSVSVNDIQSSKYRYGSNRHGNGTQDDPNIDFTLVYLANRIGLAIDNVASHRYSVGRSMPVVSTIDALQMVAVCGCRTLTISGSGSSISPANNGGSFRNILPTNSANNSYVVRRGVCYQKPEIIQDEIVKTVQINEYKNEKADYVLGISSEMSGCKRFSAYCDERGEFDGEDGYWGYVSIDPSKYWYGLVDKAGDGYVYFDENWVDMFLPDPLGVGSESAIFPLMETTTKPNTSNITGISEGTTIVIDNCLINSNYSSAVMTFMKNWLAKNEVLELVGRFDPRLELFDIINVFFDDAIYKICVEEFDLDYNGGFSGKILGRICEKQPNINYMAFTKVGGSGYLYLAHGQGLTNYPFEYSFDKLTWNNFTSNGIDMTSHNVVYIRGNNETLNGQSSNDYWYFEAQATLQLAVSGDIMSLRDKTLTNKTIPTEHYFHALFQNFTSLVDAKDLILSPTTLTNSCYMYMFNGCTNLVSAPKELPATTLTNSCYLSMFENCTSLINAPQIKATSTNGTNCCNRMFYGCSSLVNAPTLNASLMGEYVYIAMFENCTSLVNAPSLQATTLAEGCYYAMFENCTSLVNIPDLPATTLQPYCYFEMFRGCTSLVRAKSIPATTVAEVCCYSMFYGCVNLETLIALHTLTLQKWCYRRMFYNCSKIVVDETQSSGQHTYRIPDTGTGTNTGLTGLTSMFEGTGGTMNYTPVVNTTYYTENEVV